MNKKFVLLLVFAASLLTRLSAQDKHFTQFYASPLTLNPALTGVFEGKYRVGAIYRDQWRRVLDNPIRTFALAADLRFQTPTKDVREDAIGLGLLFYQDKVSVIDFATTQLAVSMAYHKALDVNNRQFLTLGIQGGLTQRNLNYEALNFHDEFDGLNGYFGTTDELLPRNNFAYGDLSIGLNYSSKIGRASGLYLGMAMHHVTEPIVSFYERERQGDKLYRKMSAQVSANLAQNNRFSIQPRFLAAVQGPHLEINTGTNFRFAFGQYGGQALHLGTWVRPVRNDSGFGLDALVLLAGIEFNKVLCGISYDLNLGALTQARTRQGAFEISIAYLGDYDSDDILCPKF
ncbi:MAG: PorP/SprF family type IX secretion system membrane protein [Saprospiraceae bacterium]